MTINNRAPTCSCMPTPKQMMICTTILLPLMCLAMFVLYNGTVPHRQVIEDMAKAQPITIHVSTVSGEHNSSGSVIKSLIRAKRRKRAKQAYIGRSARHRSFVAQPPPNAETKPMIHEHKEFTFLVGMDRIKREYNRTISSLQPVQQQKNVEPNRRCRHQGKVFAIGLMKTGSTSMVDALNILGYHCSRDSCIHLGNWHHLIDTVHLWQPLEVIVLSLLNLTDLFMEQYVNEANQALAFGDSPWCFLYPVWDRLYPNSKYILMRRESDSVYLNSYLRYLRRYRKRHVDKGLTKDEFALLALRRYHLHNQHVRQYFEHRADDLLEIVIGNDRDAWTPLVKFLGCNKPLKAFPHENKSLRQRPRFEDHDEDDVEPQIDIDVRTDPQQWDWSRRWDERDLIPFLVRNELDKSHSIQETTSSEFAFDWNTFLVPELRVPRPV